MLGIVLLGIKKPKEPKKDQNQDEEAPGPGIAASQGARAETGNKEYGPGWLGPEERRRVIKHVCMR